MRVAKAVTTHRARRGRHGGYQSSPVSPPSRPLKRHVQISVKQILTLFFCCCLSQVPFDRDSNGQLALCLEASHNRARIIHWRDETGKAITTSVQVGSVV